MVGEKVFWLGGSPCSGKSSVARALAQRMRYALYDVDQRQDEHMARALPDAQSTMAQWRQMSADQVWLRPVSQQVDSELEFYRERFAMILADIAASKKPLIVEGAALMPELLRQVGVGARQAFFMVPTWTFQMEHYTRRLWVKGVLDPCSDPDQAFENWMRRDHRFGNKIALEAVRSGWPVLRVDGTESLARTVQAIQGHWELD
jgi:hypothetical protein